MSRTFCNRVFACAVVSVLVMFAQPAVGKEPAPADTPAVKKTTAEERPSKHVVKKKLRGRLPAFFTKVVDQKQREQIYVIQKEYAPKIDELKAKLAALIKERNEKIADVLTPEQREKLQELKAAAKAKRKQAKKPKP
jgi:hypothetical protein